MTASSSRLYKHADDEIGQALVPELSSPRHQSLSISLHLSYLPMPPLPSPCIRLSPGPTGVPGGNTGRERTFRDTLVGANLLRATTGVLNTVLVSDCFQ
jgi:hypothetical protein